MINYNELYELLRKEKYGEQLQLLPKDFIEQVRLYFNEKKDEFAHDGDLFSDSVARAKKQFENSKAIFKELILRRKKKLLTLVFVAAETGIMKRDFNNLLPVEQEMFEKLLSAVESGDRQVNDLLNGRVQLEKPSEVMIIVNDDVEPIVDMSGNVVGPFKKGELVNISSNVAEILVADGKARLVDEKQ